MFPLISRFMPLTLWTGSGSKHQARIFDSQTSEAQKICKISNGITLLLKGNRFRSQAWAEASTIVCTSNHLFLSWRLPSNYVPRMQTLELTYQMTMTRRWVLNRKLSWNIEMMFYIIQSERSDILHYCLINKFCPQNKGNQCTCILHIRLLLQTLISHTKCDKASMPSGECIFFMRISWMSRPITVIQTV